MDPPKGKAIYLKILLKNGGIKNERNQRKL
jgi:hypothetical protein